MNENKLTCKGFNPQEIKEKINKVKKKETEHRGINLNQILKSWSLDF